MLIGSITNWGEIQGQINDANGVLTGVISSAELLGGEIVGLRGLKGDKGDQGNTGATGADGQDGADGFSPIATVSKVGDTTTITITDKDGTTTASVYDGEVNVNDYGKLRIFNHGELLTETARSTQDTLRFRAGENIQLALSGPDAPEIEISADGGASAFIAEYGVTSYSDVKDAYDEDAIIICTVDDSGNTVICQLAYFDDANDIFYFAQPQGDGFYLPSIAIGDTWDDGYIQFASTDVATQLRNGLMSALDWQKLDGIESGAEVNVQSDWNEADNTADDYIKNKPTIPSKTSDLNNDSGFITNASLPTDFTGATSSSAGVHGLVPAPNSGGQDKVLSADGNWYNVKITEYLDLDNNDQGLLLSLRDDSNAIKHSYTFSFKSGINILKASTSDYGFAKLSSSTSSTSHALAATPYAVKAAYDEATDATATPTASKKSKFDSSAHMNSTDMTTGADSELEDFIDGLNVSGGGTPEIITITPNSTYVDSGSIKAVCIGKIVQISMSSLHLKNTLSAETAIASIPSNLRPAVSAYGNTNNANTTFNAYTNGNLTLGATTTVTHWGTLTYITN